MSVTFSFDPRKKKPLRGGAQDALATTRRMAKLIEDANANGASLSNPLSVELDLQDDLIHGSVDDQHGTWLSAAELKNSDPEVLRMLRYKFRDWKSDALEVLNSQDNLKILGMDEGALEAHLSADNATLFAIPGEYDSLQWKCVLGFQFENHALNHVSELTGPYAPHQLDNETPQPMETEFSSPEGTPAPPPTLTGSGITPWWHGHQHQLFLVFACGFLAASLCGALFFKLSPCDISVVQGQIENMAVQLDQRCNFSQTQAQ